MYTKTPSVLELLASSAAMVATRASSCTRFHARSCAIAAHACRRGAGSADASLCRAHVEDFRGGSAAQCEPEYAARLGTTLRVSAAAALSWQAPAVHAWRGRGTARRAARGPLDLVRGVPRTRGAERRHQRPGGRPALLRHRACRWRDGGSSGTALCRTLGPRSPAPEPSRARRTPRL